MEDTTRLALRYMRMGWSVIPCHVPLRNGGCSCGRECSWPGKHPRVNWREYGQRRASRAEIVQWFEQEFYGSNVGVVTGTISNLVVVDVDHGAIDSFRELHLPYTPRVAFSGSGEGIHFFYQCRTPIPSKIGLVPNIDVKADGGFIVLPPSTHKSGRHYEWFHRGEPSEIDPRLLPTSNGGVHYRGWYEQLLTEVSEGERSKVAARLAGRYAAIGLSEDEASLLLIEGWNRIVAVPPLPVDDLKRTISWAYRTHATSVQNGSREVVSVQDLLQLLGSSEGG